MGSIVFRVIIRRFLELLFTNTVISIVLTVLNLKKILPGQSSLLFGMLAGIAMFAFINFRMLRRCYFDLTNSFLYYVSNMAAYLLFALGGVFVYFLFSSEIYTWLFAITKFLKCINSDIAIPYSAAIFHLIGFSVIFLAPIGMKWIFVYNDDGK